jgi:hypothetical protein
LVVLFTVAVNCCVPPEAIEATVGETAMETTGDTAGWTVTVALADLEVDAALVAVTVIPVLADTTGAVNKPVLEIVPPVVDQVTAWFDVLATVAVNCCVPPEALVTDVGETETETRWCPDGWMVTVALADLDGAATLVAVTVIVVVVDTAGAANNPVPEIEPAVVVQATAWFELFATVAANCAVPPERTVAETGETATETGWDAGWTVTVALADLDGAATLVAVTVIVAVVDTAGAANNPVPEIEPAVVVQATAWFELFATVAANCAVPPEETVVEAGEIATETGWDAGWTVTVFETLEVRFRLSLTVRVTVNVPAVL